MHEIQIIQPEQLYPLRSLVLRPNQDISTCYFEGDQNKDAFHLGAIIHNKIVAIGSFLPNSNSKIQIRGMATHPDYRGRGISHDLLQYGEKISRERNYKQIWCNARESAQGFYTKLQYQKTGDYFEIANIGKHIVMTKNL